MNIGTHFDYNDHILARRTGTPHEKAPITLQTEVNLLIQLSDVVAIKLSGVSNSNCKQAIAMQRNPKKLASKHRLSVPDFKS